MMMMKNKMMKKMIKMRMVTKVKEGVEKSPMNLSIKLPWKSKNFKAKSKVSLVKMVVLFIENYAALNDNNHVEDCNKL